MPLRRGISVKVQSSSSVLQVVIMRYLLCLMIALLCETNRVANAVEHSYFPDFQTVYHGHGATSYQNIHINTQNSIPFLKNYKAYESGGLHLGSGHNVAHNIPLLSFVDEHNYVDHTVTPKKFLYNSAAINHVQLIPDILSQYNDYRDHERSYSYP